MPILPPRLSRDSRTYRSRRSPPRTTPVDITSKTPRDLPGKGEHSIETSEYYPYEDSIPSTIPRETKEETVSESPDEDEFGDPVQKDLSPSEEDDLSELHVPEDNYLAPEDPDIIVLEDEDLRKNSNELEKYFIDNNFSPEQTFILTNRDGQMIYLSKISSPYGSSFFVNFDEKMIIGKEKVSLQEYEGDSRLIMISPNFTKFLREEGVVTILDDVLIYNGKVYGNFDEVGEIYNPYSYPVLEEDLVGDPFKLAIDSHLKSIDIDDFYKLELTDSFNKLMDNIDKLKMNINDTIEVFSELDAQNNEEADALYTEFTHKLEDREFPTGEETHRIRFLNKCICKYIQAQFIMIERMKQNIYRANEEFKLSSTHAFVQMKKDFPSEDFPIDESIDVKRSYPGKLFSIKE